MWGTNRRTFLRLGVSGALVGTAGCSQEFTTSSETEETERTPPDLERASFEFRYDAQGRQATIEYTGGAPLRGGNIQIRTESGTQVTWSELGSTTTDIDQRLEAGSTAELGEDVINWGEPVASDASIRLVYTGQETPATLGRFEPPESTPLTTTAPSPTTTPTATATPTTTAAPTESRPETDTPADGSEEQTTDTPQGSDTQPPSIRAFSISNPSGRRLRISFDSSEQVATITVSVSGPETATLDEDEFAVESDQNDEYSYEATYTPDSDGEYTATLETAADDAGNDGASGQEVSVTVTTTQTATYGFESELEEWDPVLDGFERTTDYAFEGSYAAGIQHGNSSGGEQIDKIATLDLADAFGTSDSEAELAELTFRWKELESSFGGGILVRNGGGDLEFFAGTDNPQWVIIGDHSAGGPGDIVVNERESGSGEDNYGRWIETVLDFDWDEGEVEVTFTDTTNDESTTETYPLNEGEPISQVELHGYTSLRYERESEPTTGSCTMYWDEIVIDNS